MDSFSQILHIASALIMKKWMHIEHLLGHFGCPGLLGPPLCGLCLTCFWQRSLSRGVLNKVCIIIQMKASDSFWDASDSNIILTAAIFTVIRFQSELCEKLRQHSQFTVLLA